MSEFFNLFYIYVHFFPDKFSGTLNNDDTSLNLPSRPAQAWLCNEKENLLSSEHTQLNGR